MPNLTERGHHWPAHFQPDVMRDGFGGGKLSSYCIALEAWRRGLDVTLEAPNATQLEISDGDTTVSFNHSRPDCTTKGAVATLRNKHRTSKKLRARGMPVPESYLFDAEKTDYTRVRERAESIGFPVVLKPVQGSVGRGVFANIANEGQLSECYRHLVEEMKKSYIMLERHHFGQDFRIYVIGERYVAACKRIPANVVGDGKSTIDQLIARKNRARRSNPFLSGGLIAKDYEVTEVIARVGYTFDSVPREGAYIALREKANASAGGDVVDMTEVLPKRIQDAAVAAVRVIPGLMAAGVDVLWNESDSSGHDGDFVIIEMNSRAHIGLNMYPSIGEGQDLPKAIIDELFPGTVRREGKAFATLRFDRRRIVDTLASGVAEKVTLAHPPAHGYPVRKIYTISPGNSLGRKDIAALSRMARRAGVACDLQLSGDNPRIALGGTSLGSICRFLDALTERLGEQPNEVAGRNPSICAGFTVT